MRQIINTELGDIEIASLDEMEDFLFHYTHKQQKDGTFRVWKLGDNEKNGYTLDLLKRTCECKDAVCRKKICKHLRALYRLLMEGLL